MGRAILRLDRRHPNTSTRYKVPHSASPKEPRALPGDQLPLWSIRSGSADHSVYS